MEGRLIGQYRVTGVLGKGGMGIVYAAKHTLLDRPAAIKVLLPKMSGDEEIVMRFFNEARAATAIQHPGIVEIYDFGWTDDGSAFIVMEHLKGETLRTRCKRTPMRWSTSLALARQIAGALSAAHGKSIVHRDLKPANIFIVPDPEIPGGERIKLLDFGIAKLGGSSSTQHMTRTGAVIGTPTYMAPEQCRGVAVDSRADIYALGCILFELCTGRPPFVCEAEGDLLVAHIREPAPTIASLVNGVPPEIETVVQRMLAKSPIDRLQTADELIRLIDATKIAINQAARPEPHLMLAPGIPRPDAQRSADHHEPRGESAPTQPERRQTPPRHGEEPALTSSEKEETPELPTSAMLTTSQPETTLSSAVGTHSREATLDFRRRPRVIGALSLALLSAIVLAFVFVHKGSNDDAPSRGTLSPMNTELQATNPSLEFTDAPSKITEPRNVPQEPSVTQSTPDPSKPSDAPLEPLAPAPTRDLPKDQEPAVAKGLEGKQRPNPSNLAKGGSSAVRKVVPSKPDAGVPKETRVAEESNGVTVPDPQPPSVGSAPSRPAECSPTAFQSVIDDPAAQQAAIKAALLRLKGCKQFLSPEEYKQIQGQLVKKN